MWIHSETCTESIDEVEITEVTQAKNECSSCTVYTVIFSVFFTISIRIATYFAYIKKDDALVMLDTRTETIIY